MLKQLSTAVCILSLTCIVTVCTNKSSANPPAKGSGQSGAQKQKSATHHKAAPKPATHDHAAPKPAQPPMPKAPMVPMNGPQTSPFSGQPASNMGTTTSPKSSPLSSGSVPTNIYGQPIPGYGRQRGPTTDGISNSVLREFGITPPAPKSTFLPYE